MHLLYIFIRSYLREGICERGEIDIITLKYETSFNIRALLNSLNSVSHDARHILAYHLQFH